jgi:tRNA dimethylallyltransferase
LNKVSAAAIEPGTSIAAIVGPTAVGKTAVGVAIAPSLNAEIVSVDAMQVYRGMDIGTNKPDSAELEAVRFHMLDIVEPSEGFSVARFKELADGAVSAMAPRGKLPLLVGGSGLYFRAVVDDLDFANTGGADLYRVEVEEEIEDMDDLELHDLLEDLDPVASADIPAANRKRVKRALEVAREGDRLMSERQHSWSDYTSPYDLTAVGLEMNREALYRLIDSRVDSMMERGLLEEVERLRASSLNRGTTAGEALGYRQLSAFLDGETTIDEAVGRIKKRTRNYAKRQLTWFKSDPRVKWFEVRVGHENPSEKMPRAIEEVSRSVLEYINDNLEN